MISLGRHPMIYPDSSLQMDQSVLDSRTCNYECVKNCLDPDYNAFSSFFLVFHFCMVPECACSPEMEETTFEMENLDQIVRKWDVTSFGSDGDLYTQEGLRVYQFYLDS
mmetsp:Transcript_37069/g.35784  ORF Transcript_37069/g.35784 Transcript_37069/m.35784 type:complete len:109 (-) Transcript_37069:427-753(-)